MKKNTCIVLCVILFFCSCLDHAKNNTVDNFATADDVSNIKAIISGETTAFLNRDSVQLLAYYSMDDSTKSAWNNPDGSFTVLHGFKAIKRDFEKVFKQVPRLEAIPAIQRDNWVFRKLSPQWMWVEFAQEIKMENGKGFSGYEFRLMKKEGGQWKIAALNAYNNHSTK